MQRAGYWVVLQEDLMKLVGVERVEAMWRVERKRKRKRREQFDIVVILAKYEDGECSM